MIAPVCASSVIGFGPFGYHLAMLGMLQIMNEIKAAQEAQKQAQKQA
jgi:3-dehydroquinate dehydratase-2